MGRNHFLSRRVHVLELWLNSCQRARHRWQQEPAVFVAHAASSPIDIDRDFSSVCPRAGVLTWRLHVGAIWPAELVSHAVVHPLVLFALHGYSAEIRGGSAMASGCQHLRSVQCYKWHV